MHELKGKTVLVTGAGRSLGRMVALHLAKLGANIAVNYNNSVDGAEQVCAEISKIGGKSIAIQADVTDSAAIRKMFHKVSSKLGLVDILVNNEELISIRQSRKWMMILGIRF